MDKVKSDFPEDLRNSIPVDQKQEKADTFYSSQFSADHNAESIKSEWLDDSFYSSQFSADHNAESIKSEWPEAFCANPFLKCVVKPEREESSYYHEQCPSLDFGKRKRDQLSLQKDEIFYIRDQVFHGYRKRNKRQTVLTSKKTFKCLMCQKHYSCWYNLKNHVKHHIGKMAFKCQICKKEFSFISSLRRHQSVHLGAQNRENLFQCQVCHKAFYRKSHLTRHQFLHTGAKPFQCQICQKGFSQSNHLKRHQAMHTKNNFECPVCLKVLTSLRGFNKHKMAIHASEKRFKCQVCLRAFHLHSSLKEHQVKHIGKKCFKCLMCQKLLTTLYSLKNHLNRHIMGTCEKLFKCQICHKAFSQSILLEQHKGTYKPFQCEICHKKFCSRTSLSRHQTVHAAAKKFQCLVCQSTFAKKHSLTYHLMLHMGLDI